jgi:endonuclease YncB( thermonuclease family)
MKKFLEKNKIFIRIITLALIFGGAIYFSKVKINKNLIGSLVNKEEFSSKACTNLPLLEDGVKKLVTKVIDGDTFLIEGGYSVRILGIDADERG